MRVAFAIENHLGHRSLMSNMRIALADEPGVEPVWLPIDATGPIVRVPKLRDKHGLVLGLRARTVLREAKAQGPYDALFLHTQRMAHLAVDWMQKTPTFLSVDSTPSLLDKHRGPDEAPPPREGSVYWSVRQALHNRTYRAARGMISMSETTKESLVRGHGVPSSRILVLLPGVDTRLFTPLEVPAASSEVHILFVGNPFERKGGLALMRWVAETKATGFHVDLVTNHTLAPDPRVTVHSGLGPNSPALVALFRRANLFVLPTLADCSSWVVAEAKAAGTAILASRIGGIPELVREGTDGWLIGVGDYAALSHRLEAVMHNPGQLAELGQRAREDAEARLDARGNARRLLEFMRDLLPKPEARAVQASLI